jgi:hypothetical protein
MTILDDVNLNDLALGAYIFQLNDESENIISKQTLIKGQTKVYHNSQKEPFSHWKVLFLFYEG